MNQNHLVTGNILYAASPRQNVFYFDERNDYGVMKDNYFCKPFSDKMIHEGKSWPGMGPHQHFTLDTWQKKYSWADTSPKTDISKLGEGEEDKSRIFVNKTEQSKKIALEGYSLNPHQKTVKNRQALKNKIIQSFAD